ncbi:MAG: UDP-N-acetylmuramoyl-L-alanine--D-glutamate ligase [Candidatus Dormibacteraceae bacterium]
MLDRFSTLKGRRVGAWGMGREIRSLARAMRRHFNQGLALVAVDSPGEVAEELAEAQVNGDAILPALLGCDIVIRSPGVSAHRSELRRLRQQGIPVVTSTGLWLAEPRSVRVIGVTGTKGKSTTASLTAHILQKSGLRVELAGNIGKPAIELLDVPEPDCYVLELSSHQITDLEVGVDIAVFTNLYPEHIDWHGSCEQYFADKLRLATLMPTRTVVINACDERLRHMECSGDRVMYGCAGCFTVSGGAVWRDGERFISGDFLPLPGDHNLLNLCASLTAAEMLVALPSSLEADLESFQPLPHRFQSVGIRSGVEWIDDSISTTPESTIAAIHALPERPLVLIGGGYDRQQDYRALAVVLASRDVVIIGLPSTGTRLVRAARDAGVAVQRLIESPNLEAAVDLARDHARPGGVILLSPAAPSFGQFSSFEERGRRFTELAGFI